MNDLRLSKIRFAAFLVGLFGLISLSGFVCADQNLPDSDLFAKYVVQVLETYPTDGTHQYWWPKKSQWQGVTRDIYYQGEVVAEGDPEGRCYCCGLTWEVFLRATEEYNKEQDPDIFNNWTREQIGQIRQQWFGSDGNKRCLHNAVLTNNIGIEITDPEQVKRGDFIQLWRNNGSGHSVVFDRWIRDESGEIAKMRYWSTQPKTKGIAYNEEPVGEGTRDINLDKSYFVRIGKLSEAVEEPKVVVPAAAD